jgi:hypothetical protein
VATIDFLARGGDQYPYRGAEFTVLGVSYQQALADYISEGLGGQIAASEYPEGGEGRIETSDIVANDDSNDDELPSTEAVAALAVHQNYPNPFNPMTNISFDLPRSQHVRVAVYDVAGRLVRELMNGKGSEGNNTLTWEGTDTRGNRVPSGVYLYRVTTSNQVETRRMTLVK